MSALEQLEQLAARENAAGRGDAFDELRGELRRAAWWSRTWALAYMWNRGIGGGVHGCDGARGRGARTVLRPTRVSLSSIQSWRVHKHEKQAWARLEELTS